MISYSTFKKGNRYMSTTKGKVNWNPNYLWFKLLGLSLCYTLKSQEKQTVISKRTNTYNQHQTIASTERKKQQNIPHGVSVRSPEVCLWCRFNDKKSVRDPKKVHVLYKHLQRNHYRRIFLIFRSSYFYLHLLAEFLYVCYLFFRIFLLFLRYFNKLLSLDKAPSFQ